MSFGDRPRPITGVSGFEPLQRACSPMTIRQWRALKGIFYVLIMASVSVVAIVEQQVFVPIVFILAAMLIFGIELSEVQIAQFLTISFMEKRKQESEDDND